MSINILPYVFRCSYVGCLNIYNCYIFFLVWSLDHYVVSFLVSCNTLYFKVYFWSVPSASTAAAPLPALGAASGWLSSAGGSKAVGSWEGGWRGRWGQRQGGQWSWVLGGGGISLPCGLPVAPVCSKVDSRLYIYQNIFTAALRAHTSSVGLGIPGELPLWRAGIISLNFIS